MEYSDVRIVKRTKDDLGTDLQPKERKPENAHSVSHRSSDRAYSVVCSEMRRLANACSKNVLATDR
jgi:hypothetical protein